MRSLILIASLASNHGPLEQVLASGVLVALGFYFCRHARKVSARVKSSSSANGDGRCLDAIFILGVGIIFAAMGGFMALQTLLFT